MPRKKRDYRKVSSRHSAMVVERQAAAVDLAASLAAQGDTVATGLEEELRCVLREGEEMPDFRFLLELMERRVELAREQLDEADEKRFLEEMKTSVARHEAKEAHRDLYAAAVEVRKGVVASFGSKRPRLQFGLSERTPRGQTDLAWEARRLVDRLSRSGLELPEARLPGLEADPEGWVARLRPSLERLEGLLKEITQRRVVVIDRIADCQSSRHGFDATYLHVARAAEAIFVLAGQPELARRLRPTRHRERSVERGAAPLPLAGVAVLHALSAGVVRFWRRLRGAVLWTPAKALQDPKTHKTGVLALARGIPRAEIG